MSEQEIFDHLEKMCILDELCYEVDCLDEKDLEVIRELIKLYNKRKETMKSQEKIIMEQEKEIDKYTKQEFGNLFNGKYISKDKIKDILKKYEKRPLEEGICFYKEIKNLLED